MESWLKMSAGDLGRGIAAGDISPRALTETYLDAIAAHDARDRIYTVVTKERARSEADAAETRAKLGQRRSLVDGVPISWKDLFDSAGTATEAGSDLLKGRVPTLDATVLQRATALGAVCLGKTHMSELAFSGLGLNPVKETPPCINFPDAVPGGSSSGAAASVAHGLAVCGIGSDTGGSVRIPAGWNDLVGLKTTSRRISTDGVVALCPEFDTIGPLARTVEDAALYLGMVEQGQSIDLKGARLDGMRFAALQTLVLDDLEPEVADAYAQTLKRLEAAGARIEPLEVPEVHDSVALERILYTTEAYGMWKEQIEAAPELMFAEILERFRAGAEYSGADYVAAWVKMREIRGAWQQATAGYDGVLLPTSPLLPPNLKRLMEDHAYFTHVNILALRNTRIGNMMGSCGLSLPTGFPSCGLQVLAAPMTEEALLRVGAAIESALA
ncbi:amidase [Epibacterium sp. SM1969]|uniref:Amidase n=1 Tax=Tritonibacter aquimaris TaxID=2663379 RepID=A0A844AX72_9RHOB|nr:amidase family protein [Tritonibacter aquimaris]MQY41776.1 amidase [Tritonibacter aquimaris]